MLVVVVAGGRIGATVVVSGAGTAGPTGTRTLGLVVATPGTAVVEVGSPGALDVVDRGFDVVVVVGAGTST